MTKFDFSEKTKKEIAEAANYRCSWPTCGRSTTGPGRADARSTRAGKAAHIYSSAENGPRGRGGLTEQEIRSKNNGIWLCDFHERIIDHDHGKGHPAELLISYKGLHENRIQKEIFGFCSPVGWLHEIEIVNSPIFRNGQLFENHQKVRLGKLNLIYGDNATGKTTLWKLIAGVFMTAEFTELEEPLIAPIDIRISYLQPEPLVLQMQIKSDLQRVFRIGGQQVPWNPLTLKIIAFTKIKRPDNSDDRQFLSTLFQLQDWQVQNLLDEINSFPAAKIRNAKFLRDEDGVSLYLDLNGWEQSLNSLSSSEEQIVWLEFATAMARHCARYCPTLLVLDFPFSFQNNWFSYYNEHLLHSNNQFQTILCIPSTNLDLDSITWEGWETIRLDGQRSGLRKIDYSYISFSQQPRTKH